MSPVEGDQLAQAGERVVFARGTTVELDEADDRGDPPEEAEARSLRHPCRGGLVAEVGATGIGRKDFLRDGEAARAQRRDANLPAEMVEEVTHGGYGAAESVWGCFPACRPATCAP